MRLKIIWAPFLLGALCIYTKSRSCKWWLSSQQCEHDREVRHTQRTQRRLTAQQSPWSIGGREKLRITQTEWRWNCLQNCARCVWPAGWRRHLCDRKRIIPTLATLEEWLKMECYANVYSRLHQTLFIQDQHCHWMTFICLSLSHSACVCVWDIKFPH